MARQRIEVTQEFNMPVERLFNALADHGNLSKVFGIPVKRIKDGQGDVNGVGSVRALGFAPLATEETVVAVEPNLSIDYKVTKNGGPLSNHHGRLDFAKTSSGSRVTWVITFDALPVIGTLLNKFLGSAISRGLRKLG
ncbi:MAG: SRPBCC family protein [Pseudomonadota bacterium]